MSAPAGLAISPELRAIEGHGFRAPAELAVDRTSGTPADRRGRLVRAGLALRERLLASPRIKGVTSVALATFPYPSRYGLRDALALPWPFLALTNRVFIVRYDDFAGTARTLLVSPSDVDANAETPFFKGLVAQMGRFRRVLEPLLTRRGPDLAAVLAQAGVRPEDVDFITYDHLHTQDLRRWLGPAPLFPRARLLVTRAEWRSVHGLSAPQLPWYCPRGIDGVPDDRVLTFDDGLELGHGVVLVATPGHTEGNHSIVLHGPEGLTVTSENGIAPDAYAPAASSIPGLRAYARRGMDIVLNGNTLERGLDQYLSMVLEKTIAGPSARDPRFPAFLASSELTPVAWAPGLAPGLAYGDLAWGARR